MLKITVLGTESFDNDLQEFVTVGDVDLEFEHSLVSLSKWESIFEKPFLTKDEKTSEEVLSYLHAMLLTPNIPFTFLSRLSQENLEEIRNYIDSKRSATWFSDIDKGPQSQEVITSELIYYWMIAHNIPIECENWHLSRLFTLIRVCNTKNSPPKQMSPSEAAAWRREMNAKRKAQLGSSG